MNNALSSESHPTYMNYKGPFAARAGTQRLIVVSKTDGNNRYGND
jgi:hypothetical protein